MIRRSMFFCAALPVAALSAVAAPVRAQDSAPVGAAIGIGYIVLGVGALHRLLESGTDARVGADVQVTAVSGASLNRLRGKLTTLDPDSITVVADSATHRIARTDIRTMSSFAGTEQKWAQGFSAGFVAGGALGAVLGFASGNDTGPNDFMFTANQKAAILGTFGAFSGSIIGAIVGVATSGDHWVRVDRIPGASRVTATPIAGRTAGVGVNIRF